MIRLAGLLHDVGHGPFSHVFDSLLKKKLGKTHEDITLWIVTCSELKDIIKREGHHPEEVGKLATGNLQKPGKTFFDQIISSSLDVDKLDFVLRDTYHTGAQYGYVDIHRLIQRLDVLDENLAEDLGALSTLESLFIARIESFKSIYFHRVARAAQIMLVLAMEKANEELALTRFATPEDYLAMDDYTVWTQLKNCKQSKDIIEKLERRKLLKCTYERTFFDRKKTILKIFEQETYRNQLREDIAAKAGIAVEEVIIDVPTVPSVPFHHLILKEPIEIPTFYKTRKGTKIPRKLSEVSKIFDVFKGLINIFRVYSSEERRAQVGKATSEIVGGILSLDVAY